VTYRKTLLSGNIAAALLFATSVQAHVAQQGSPGPSGQPPEAAAAQSSPQASASQQAASTASNDSRQSGRSQETRKNNKATVQELQTVQVVGIRASLQQALEIKRAANSIVDAVTSEDLGKFPNTDVAEAMTQIPGVTIDRIFGQGSGVSIDGTDPSLNLTFLNGHQVAQMAWLGSGQSRGFDFTILPPELVGNVVVYKTSQAKLPEGSIGGTIMVNTRQPLDLKANTFAASIGGTYNQTYGKAKPKGSALYSWKNSRGSFGFLVSASSYEQQIDRQGVEIFSYFPVSNYVNAPGAAGSTAKSPSEVNAAWFLQDRKRTSGNFAIQFKPTDRLEFGLNGLYLHEKYNNVNQSMYAFAQIAPQNVDSISPAASGVVNQLHVCSDVFSPTCANPAAAQGHAVTMLDSDPRVSSMNIRGIYLIGKYSGDRWGVDAKIGMSAASNPHTTTYADEAAYAGGYTLDINNGATYDDPAAVRDPHNWLLGGQNGSANFTIGSADQYNRMSNAQVDFHNDFDSVLNRLDYGIRYNENYVRVTPTGFVADDPRTQISEADLGVDGFTDILGDFSGFSPDMQHRIFPDVDKQIAFQKSLHYKQLASSTVNGKYVAEEKTGAAYVQQNFVTDTLSGNIGLRYVKTDTTSSAYQPTGPAVFPIPASWWKTTRSSYHFLLPSFNIAYTPTDTVTLRAAAAKVIARQTISNEIPSLSLNAANVPPVGSGGNPELLPYKATNYSVAAEWNFKPQAAVGFEAFLIRINNYILRAPSLETHFTDEAQTAPQHFQQLVDLGFCDAATNTCQYSVSRPQNLGSGKVRGFNVSYQQYFGESGLGLITNFTYSNGTSQGGGPLPYNSKYSVNFSPYYEKGHFSARITYQWRSKYFTAGYQVSAPSTFVNDYDELDATVSWMFNKHWSVTLSGLNLTNTRYFQYDLIKAMPANRYYNGTLYLASLHFKL